MACRVELYVAGLLLLLSLLHTNHSAPVQNPLYTEAIKQMTKLGNDALKHLKTKAAAAMREQKGPHTVGCLRETRKDDRLDCGVVSTLARYMKNATELEDNDNQMREMLLSITQHVEDLHANLTQDKKCSKPPTKPCEKAFHIDENPERLRSLLVLFLQWIDKPMK